MVNERSEHKTSGFWFLFEKFHKDLKRFNVKKLLPSAQQFFCTGSTLLPHVVACFHSVRRSFEQFHNLNNRQRSFPHHSIPTMQLNMPFLYKLKVFLTARRNTAAYCIFFSCIFFGTPDSGTKFRRYQVFIRYHGASAGMTKGNRLSKRKRNVLRRDDCFYFHRCSFQICITDQA